MSPIITGPRPRSFGLTGGGNSKGLDMMMKMMMKCGVINGIFDNEQKLMDGSYFMIAISGHLFGYSAGKRAGKRQFPINRPW